MVLFAQFGSSEQIGSIWAKGCCTWSKWFYLCKLVLSGQVGCIGQTGSVGGNCFDLGKMVVFGKKMFLFG